MNTNIARISYDNITSFNSIVLLFYFIFMVWYIAKSRVLWCGGTS